MINAINYRTPIKYISGFISEYDIAKANISVLRAQGIIDDNLYQELYKAPRMERQVYIGKRIKEDKDFGKYIKNGIAKYKQQFYEANNITENNIISIHNDSLFLLNTKPLITSFDEYVNFTFRGSYIMYCNISGLEMYYSVNQRDQTDNLTVKGINDIELKKHENYFIDFLKTIFYERECINLESALSMIKDFNELYLNYKLEPGYYREFNSNSRFQIGNGFYSDFLLPEQFQYIDIRYNYNIIRELFEIYTKQYFNKL